MTLEDALEGLLRRVIKEEIHAFKAELNGQDRLLDAEEASKILCVSPDWLYRHGDRLPFTRKLAPRVLRFSYQGIQKYLSTRKTS
ncbi:MAG: hypothetical protein ACE5I0_06040 [Candidatus Binatia bacterium]